MKNYFLQRDIMLERKGITPVIATVLLLGITFAVGAVLFTQVQGFLEGGEGQSDFQELTNTEMRLSPVYAAGESLNVTIRNTGKVAFNTSDFEMQFVPPESTSELTYDIIERTDAYPAENSQYGEFSCFDADTQTEVLNPGDTYTCSTGLKFPDTLQSLGIVVKAKGIDKSWDTTCKPQREGSVSC